MFLNDFGKSLIDKNVLVTQPSEITVYTKHIPFDSTMKKLWN